MAEGRGIEPLLDLSPDYGLATRYISTLSTFRIFFFFLRFLWFRLRIISVQLVHLIESHAPSFHLDNDVQQLSEVSNCCQPESSRRALCNLSRELISRPEINGTNASSVPQGQISHTRNVDDATAASAVVGSTFQERGMTCHVNPEAKAITAGSNNSATNNSAQIR